MAARTFGTRKKRNEGRWLLASVLMATTALVMTPKAEAQSRLELPSRDGFTMFRATGVSGDGRVVIGTGQFSAEDSFGVHYRDGQVTRMEGDGNYGVATAVNGIGDIVVGHWRTDQGWDRAVRWVLGAHAVELGTLTPNIAQSHSWAYGVSGDGRRVAGTHNHFNMNRAFVWIEGFTGGVEDNEQMYQLPGLIASGRQGASGISDNGRYVVGYSDGDAITEVAVRWDLQGIEDGVLNEPKSLGGLDGNGGSRATAVSADGNVVVGRSSVSDGSYHAFRWVEGADGGVEGNLEMYDLGTLGGMTSEARAVSRNGLWVVGQADDETDTELAFRWSEEGGMESVADWLDRHGVSVGTPTLARASGISDDGSVVVGDMYVDHPDNTRAFIARVDGDGTGVMDVEEYHQTLYSAAGIANTGEFLTWLPMNGAHHRPLMLTPNLSGDMCAWATGDFAHHGETGTGLALAEIGACTDLAGGNVRIGGSIGATSSWQDLALGGSARMQGQYVLSEIDWQPDGTPLLLSLTGMVGSYQAQIDRAYSNGAATAHSMGETDAFGGVIRARADWLEAAVLGNTSINPYASVALGGLHVNGYTETGGPFPAVFNAQSLAHADIRVGVTAITEFSATTKLSTTLEVAHRTGNAAAATGNVPGLFNFALGGGTYAQTWARVGAEIDHKINENLSLSASAHLATTGRDPSLSFSAGFKGAF